MIAISKSDFNYVRDLVRRHSAISLEPDKAYLIETRLAPLARQTGFDSLQALIASLRTKPGADLRDRVIEAMFTHETSFFRDGHPFEILKSMILPNLLAKRSPSQNLTIWCAACSSGQEPFSVAMLAREHFPDLARGRLRTIATDLSEPILARAREGLYTQTEINRGLPRLARSLLRQTGFVLASQARNPAHGGLPAEQPSGGVAEPPFPGYHFHA